MGFHIRSIDLFVRKITPPRMDFAIGKGQSLFPDWMRINVEVRLMLESDDGRSAFGCSADWPSFGWLDKRSDVAPKQKFVELLKLLESARRTYLANPDFAHAFDVWQSNLVAFHELDSVQSSVPLCASFANALIERALLDACCRLEGVTFFESLQKDLLGFEPGRIHPELSGVDIRDFLPEAPLNRIQIRHTIGPNDPLVASDVNPNERLHDGEPFTLEEYVAKDGISYFKIKICGDVQSDLERLASIWSVIRTTDPLITLDGNEAYDDAQQFEQLVQELAERQPELFERVSYIEQPMNRAITLDPACKTIVQRISKIKPLIIDEADGTLHAFSESVQIGYQGVSHKNCKGIFKSLANFALAKKRNSTSDRELFISAEDLTSLPYVALHQDFSVVSALGLTHAERNGHHFFLGLNHLAETERIRAGSDYPGLYKQHGGNWSLNIERGSVDISSLQIPGLGVACEPDWSAMTLLEKWLVDFDSPKSG